MPGSRDTIQEYIDLWEQLPTADKHSIPPTPPPKDGKDYLNAINDLRKNPRTREKSVMLTPKIGGGGKIMPDDQLWIELEVEDVRSPLDPPPVFEQIQTAFLGLQKEELVDTDASSLDSRISPDTPKSYANSYVAVVGSNPFDSQESLPIPVESEIKLSPPEVECRLTSPFSPEDMWIHHIDEEVSEPPRAGTPNEARVSAVGSKAHAAEREKNRRGRGSRPPSIHVDVSARPKEPVPATPTPTSTASTPFTTYEEYHPLTPRPFSPMPKHPTHGRRRDSLRLRATSSSSSGASTSTADSSFTEETTAISAKAAKMLGIDAKRTFPAFDPERARRGSITQPRRPSLHARRSSLSDPSSPYRVPKDYVVSPISPHYRIDSTFTGHMRGRSDQTWDTREVIASPILDNWVRQPYDAQLDAACVWKALKKSKKPDVELLSSTLVSVSHEPHKIVQLRQKYKELYAEDMLKDIKSETSGNYRLALTRLIGGPHEAEAQWLNKSDASFFMDDKLVAEALFGKSSVDIKLIMFHYEQATGTPLQKALEDLYLSGSHSYSNGSAFDAAGTTGAFGRACIRALKADREVETVEGLNMMSSDRTLERESRLMLDIEDLYKTERGTGGPKYLNQALLLELIMTKSDLYLSELCRKFYERHGKQLTELAVAKDRSKMLTNATFPVNLGYAVAYALNGAVNKPQRDAKLLEDCVKGIGTQDNRLIARLLRIHYDPDSRHLPYVKEVYQQKYGKDLIERIRSNTKGPYRGLLMKLLEGRSQMAAESFF